MTRTICSIHYHELRARRSYRLRDTEEGGFNTVFVIPAAPRDGYKLLTVRDMEEDYKFSSEAPRTVMTKETTGEKVAACLVGEWGGNVSNSEIGGLGIFVCTELDKKDPKTGKVLEPATEPGPNELRQARASKTRWCQMRCLEAADWARTGKSAWISDHVHVAAGMWLGESYSWMRAPSQKLTADCPACGSEVKPGIFVCPGCKEIIDPVGYAAFKKEAADTGAMRERLEKQAEAAGELIAVGAGPKPFVKK